MGLEKYWLFRKKGLTPMRPYVPGEDMTGVSVSKNDVLEDGGMIALNPDDANDRWYVSRAYFEENYEQVVDDEQVRP